MNIATGDVNGDLRDDIIVAPGGTGFAPVVKVFNAASLSQVLWSKTVYASNYLGGVTVASADVDNDGRGDIIAAPGGTGVAATVKVFSGLNYGLLFSRNVFNAGFTGGVSVAGGDVDGDGKADIICTPFSGGGPRVQVYSGANGALLRDQTLFATTSTSGYSVAAEDLNRDGKADIILLDRAVSGLVGGTGQKFDWSLAVEAKKYATILLAGGLNPANVAEAIRQVQPWGVDVASGVETAPGVKDAGMIQEFIRNARTASELLH